MTYEEAYLYMKEAGKRGSIYGTETVKELLLRLGNPQDRVPCRSYSRNKRKRFCIRICRAYSGGCRVCCRTLYIPNDLYISGTISDKWTLYARIGICTDHGDRDPGLRGYGGSRASDPDRF